MSIKPWMTVPEGRTAMLSNWRQPPHSAWSFGNTRSLLPSEAIDRRIESYSPFVRSEQDIRSMLCECPSGKMGVGDILELSSTDAFLVLKDGLVIAEYYFGDMRPDTRHVMFSVSKSVLGLLVGILTARGLIDPARQVIDFVPELRASAYGEATVQQVLDMTVAVDFREDYQAKDADVDRYRRATGWDPSYPDSSETMRGMLTGLARGVGQHGERFLYVSPGTDVAGWVVERVTGLTYPQALATFIWKPMGAEFSADMTVDKLGAARAAGGLCATLRDVGRVGTLMTGMPVEDGLAPEAFLADTYLRGDPDAWMRGASASYIPGGRYRNKWYVKPGHDKACLAIGIHGQWIYANCDRNIVMVKQSSQPTPVDAGIDQRVMAMFDSIARQLG